MNLAKILIFSFLITLGCAETPDSRCAGIWEFTYIDYWEIEAPEGVPITLREFAYVTNTTSVAYQINGMSVLTETPNGFWGSDLDSWNLAAYSNLGDPNPFWFERTLMYHLPANIAGPDILSIEITDSAYIDFTIIINGLPGKAIGHLEINMQPGPISANPGSIVTLCGYE